MICVGELRSVIAWLQPHDTELLVANGGVGRPANQPNSLQVNRLSRNTT
jgi:hypothetical protein